MTTAKTIRKKEVETFLSHLIEMPCIENYCLLSPFSYHNIDKNTFEVTKLVKERKSVNSIYRLLYTVVGSNTEHEITIIDRQADYHITTPLGFSVYKELDSETLSYIQERLTSEYQPTYTESEFVSLEDKIKKGFMLIVKLLSERYNVAYYGSTLMYNGTTKLEGVLENYMFSRHFTLEYSILHSSFVLKNSINKDVFRIYYHLNTPILTLRDKVLEQGNNIELAFN